MSAAAVGTETRSKETFLDAQRLAANGPRPFLRAVERLLWHLGFDDVRNIDGPGDEGGDLIAHRAGYRWVFQCKWKKRGLVPESAVREVDAAKAFYGADRAVVATNRAPGVKAVRHRQKLLAVGVRIDFWGDETLKKFAEEVIPDYVPARYDLYPYQRKAVEEATSALEQEGRALVIMATGLGKTVVGGEVVDWHLKREPTSDVLVVAHVKELVSQLERAIWRHIPKWTPTQTLTGDARPDSLTGVTCATVQSALQAVENGWRPRLVLVDEAHHVSEEGVFQRLLDELEGAQVMGLTATPWRGDAYDIKERFGMPVFKMGIAEGMASGFLAEVDYRLFADELDWGAVSQASERGLTVKELNRRLFLPQRDEAIVDRLREAWEETLAPRAIVYCRTINHAEEVADLLKAAGWRRAECINTGLRRRDRDLLMSEFRDGRIPILTAVDIFNEGVDVPDVNILCFARVTHSRRIFVQQLGRGLRLSPTKDKVRVLDFVSDVRRVAATLDLQRSLDRLADEDIERVKLPHPVVTFSEPRIGSLLQEWIKDAASLEDADEEVKLQFPDVPDLSAV
jgi:superfamily II DNA or RNA helicase